MKIAFGTVAYKTDYSYDFFESLRRQTNQDFDIIIMYDNNTETEIRETKLEWGKRIISLVPKDHTPFKMRIELIRQAKLLEYDLLIIGDYDDKFADNRVEQHLAQFDPSYIFFYHELLDFNHMVLFDDLPEKTEIYNIVDYNYVGLSNSALNLRKISLELIESLYNGPTLVFDWYLFSRLLLLGYEGKRISNTCTNYRLHENNIAGVPQITIESMLKEITVKMNHYRHLIKYDEQFEEKLEKYKALKIEYDNGTLQIPLKQVNKYWWGIFTS